MTDEFVYVPTVPAQCKPRCCPFSMSHLRISVLIQLLLARHLHPIYIIPSFARWALGELHDGNGYDPGPNYN
jgi:hypothetical protein